MTSRSWHLWNRDSESLRLKRLQTALPW